MPRERIRLSFVGGCLLLAATVPSALFPATPAPGNGVAGSGVAGSGVPGSGVAAGAKFPVYFEPATGSAAASQRFVSRGPGYLAAFSSGAMEMHLRAGAGPDADSDADWQTLRMELAGADQQAPGHGIGPLPGRSNYLLGNAPAAWRRAVPHYEQIRFDQVYPGIAVVYRAAGRTGGLGDLEYDFVLESGADPSRIRIRFDGADDALINTTGELVLRTSSGEVRQKPPLAYQELTSGRTEVQVSFASRGHDTFGFSLGPYDSAEPLIIDPRVEFSTYLGGSDLETINEAIIDEANGRIIVAGWTYSLTFPARPEGSFANFLGIRDGFVAALTADGSTLLWTTFIGTPGDEQIAEIKLLDDVIWMTGFTNDPNFPITDPNPFAGRLDTFVFGLSTDGDRIVYGRYSGGIDAEQGMALDVCRRGEEIIVAQGGRTDGRDYPITGGQPFHGGGLLDSFVEVQVIRRHTSKPNLRLKERAAGYMGGIGEESGKEVIITGCEEPGGPWILLGSEVTSQGLPTGTLPFQASASGGVDVHLMAWRLVGGSGVPLDLVDVGGTYIGGAGDDLLADMEVTPAPDAPGDIAAGKIGVLLTTDSKNLPTSSFAYRSKLPGDGEPAMYVMVLSGDELGSIFDTPDEDDPFWATYLGTAGSEQGGGLVLDPNGCAVIAGATNSLLYPVSSDAVQSTYGGGDLDAVVTRICGCGHGSWIEFSSFFGGGGRDLATDIIVDSLGQYYVVGQGGVSFPTTADVLQPTFGGGAGDGFVAKFRQVYVQRAGIGNAAKFTPGKGGGISPQEIVTGFGVNLGPETPAGPMFDGGLLLRNLAGARVLVGTRTSPMLFASKTQTSFITLGFIRPPGPVAINFEFEGDLSTSIEVPIVESNPGIFSLDSSGTGQGAILNPDFSVNGPQNPAAGFIVVYGTGGGGTAPPCPDGGLAAAVEPLNRLKLPVTATVGGEPADVLYAGSAPGLVCGVNQWTIQPRNNPSGAAVPVLICVGETCTQEGITAAFE